MTDQREILRDFFFKCSVPMARSLRAFHEDFLEEMFVLFRGEGEEWAAFNMLEVGGPRVSERPQIGTLSDLVTFLLERVRIDVPSRDDLFDILHIEWPDAVPCSTGIDRYRDFESIQFCFLLKKRIALQFSAEGLPSIWEALADALGSRVIDPLTADPESSAMLVGPSELLCHASNFVLFDLSKLLFDDPQIDLHEQFDKLSLAMYERKAVSASLALCPATKADMRVELVEPVSLRETRGIRKLLEACRSDLELLCTATHAYGLGGAKRGAVRVNFTGRHRWHVRYLSDQNYASSLYEVRDGLPQAPREPLSYRDFVSFFHGRMDTEHADLKKLYDLCDAVIDSMHGAVLVISPNASEEARRLATQAFQIGQRQLEPREISDLAAIDGAVLIDDRGLCHAFGVILDGVSAPEVESRSRGARFNSVLRYLTGRSDCVALVVSEDGDYSFHPRSDQEAIPCNGQTAITMS